MRFYLDNTFWGVGSTAEEQSRYEANIVAQGDGKFGPEVDPRIPPKPKNIYLIYAIDHGTDISHLSQILISTLSE